MKGMSPVIKVFARAVTGGMVIFGFYLFLHGHVSHGAGFAGGVVIALGMMLMLLAFGKDEVHKRLDRHRALFIGAIILLFLAALAVIGFYSKPGFAGNYMAKGTPFALLSSGTIIVSNIALCLITAASLVWIFMSLVSFNRPDADAEEQ